MKNILFCMLLLASSVSVAAPYNWGQAPEGVTLPSWPNPPSAQNSVSVSNLSQLNSALAAGNSAVILTGNISNEVNVSSNDNSIDLNGFSIGGIVVERGSKRLKVFNGLIDGDFQIGGSDILFDNVLVTPSASNAVLGEVTRYAMINSTISTQGGYPTYCSEYSNHIIIANSNLETSAGPASGLRCMGADHLVVVDSRIKGVDNAQLRLHAGDSSEGAVGGMHDVWIARNQIEGNGGPGAFWINLASGTPIDPNATMSRFVVEDNNMYQSNFGINTDRDPLQKYFNMTFRRNTSYWTATMDEVNYDAAGGDTSNGFIFPLTGPNANTATYTIPAPIFTGGYGGAIPNPDVGDPIPSSDVDDDGVEDDLDNCPSTPNPDQTDSDNNGLGDACDAPSGSGGSNSSSDKDGDSINDSVDNCPAKSNRDQKDSDGDSIGDICDNVANLDFDGDKVTDSQDNCPFIYNKGQADRDNDGYGNKCDSKPRNASIN